MTKGAPVSLLSSLPHAKNKVCLFMQWVLAVLAVLFNDVQALALPSIPVAMLAAFVVLHSRHSLQTFQIKPLK